MRILLALVFVALLPPPKEWQSVIDATTTAIRKKDAAALEKLLMSFAEVNATCGLTSPAEKQAEELDKNRAKRVAGAIEDCNIMDWKKAKFVSASGGEPDPKFSKCEKYKPAKSIDLVYDEGELRWTISLEPVVLSGKHLLRMQPRCLSSVKK